MENWGNLTPTVPKTLEPMATKFGVGDDVCAATVVRTLVDYCTLSWRCPGFPATAIKVTNGQVATSAERRIYAARVVSGAFLHFIHRNGVATPTSHIVIAIFLSLTLL